MLQRLTTALLWDKKLTGIERRAWGALILVAPLALVAGVWLQLLIMRQIPVHIGIDRDTALRIARKTAEERGIETSGWRDTVKATTDWNEYRLVVTQGHAGRQALDEFGAWGIIKVTLAEPDGAQRFSAALTPSGKVTGYTITRSDPPEPGAANDETHALALAEAAIADRVKQQPRLHFSGRRVSTSTDSSLAKTYDFTWTVAAEGLEGLTGEAVVGVRKQRLVRDTLEFNLTDEAKDRLKRTGKSVYKGFYFTYVGIVFIFVLVRYVKRRVQKEASRQRMYLVTLVIASFIVATMILLDIDVNIQNAQVVPAWVPILFIVLMGFLAGLAGGITYAGAESDLRETRPGLLTSLDALLSGRLFSRNVGRSVVLGVVVLAWMLVLRNLVYLSARSMYPGMDSLDGGYNTLFSEIPWLSLLLTALAMSVFFCLSTILGPLTVLQRYVKNQWRIVLFLAPLTWFSLAFATDEQLRFPFGSIVSMVQMGGMLASFFAVDLLATVVVGAGFAFVVYFYSLSELAPLWSPHVNGAMILAGAILVAAILCAFFGKVVRESEVRPKYARDIEERLQLQSEVEAAREAQNRLLPAGPPSIPGLAVAASCSAAEEVSGDFYDFFPIGTRRLGILISDGGGNGLATALSIAMTKGYLMHKSQAGLSPVETLRGLQSCLGQGIHGIDAEGLCYVVVDLNDATVRYARLGETPSILIAGGAEPNEIHYQQEGLALWEGFARLSAAAPVIFYSNGLSRLIGEPDRSSTNRWLRKRINGIEDQAAGKLHDSILKTVFTKRAGLGRRKAKDDVTVIVVSLDRAVIDVLEHVA